MSPRALRAWLIALCLVAVGCGHYGPPSRTHPGAATAGAPSLTDPTCTEDEETP